MLAPHELKNKAFGKSLKGYNVSEVDDYIEFLIDKYTEAYRENNELERKLRVVANNLEEIKDQEESIRSTLISAQKMGEKIIKDANERADIITGAIKDRCDAIIVEFKEQLQKEKEEMWTIRTRILDFKKEVFELYRNHIEELKDLSVNEIEDIVLPDEDKIVSKIFTDVKGTIEEELEKSNLNDPDMEEDPAITAEIESIKGDESENSNDKAEESENTEIASGEAEEKPEEESKDESEVSSEDNAENEEKENSEDDEYMNFIKDDSK